MSVNLILFLFTSILLIWPLQAKCEIKNITIENLDAEKSQTLLYEYYTNLENKELLKIEFKSDLIDDHEFTDLCEQIGFKIHYRHREAVLLPNLTLDKRWVIILKKQT
jgi:hypothetical protein